ASSDSAASNIATYAPCQAYDQLFTFVTPDKYFLIFQGLLPLHPQPKHNNKLFQFPQSTWLLNTLDMAPHSHRSEEHTSELQSRFDLVCRLLLEKKKTYVLLSYNIHIV